MLAPCTAWSVVVLKMVYENYIYEIKVSLLAESLFYVSGRGKAGRAKPGLLPSGPGARLERSHQQENKQTGPLPTQVLQPLPLSP